MSLGHFIIRRLLLASITILVVSVIIFTITEVLPGDIAQMVLGREATPEALTAMRNRLGLDRPAHVRYLEWLWNAVNGDLGVSLFYGMPIGPILLSRMRNSFILAGLGLFIGVPSALILGVIAGLNPGRLPDTCISVVTLIGVSIPEFVSSVVLIFVFGVKLGWFPETSILVPGANPLLYGKHLVLPLTALTLMMLAHVTRMIRAGMIEVMHSSYVRTAFLKGLPLRTVVLKHALRNALLPTITVIASYVGWLIGGIVIVETIFAYPGLGRLLILAIINRDVPLLESTALLLAVIRIGSNFVADMLYAYLNPRIRY